MSSQKLLLKGDLGKFLKRVDIFSSLDAGELKRLAQSFRIMESSAGTQLFAEGNEGNEMYLVYSGRVVTTVSLPDGKTLELATFGTGDFFGEMSIFEQAPRSATCTTRDPSCLLALHEQEFFRFLTQYPQSAIKIMYRMLNITAGRLMNTGQFLSDMVQWGESARKRAITDEMTGLYNRRFLDDSIEAQFQRAKAEGRPLTVIMVDLDRFREINEAYGIAAGDDVILAVAPVFKEHMKPTDILARYGGDEFTFVCPDTNTEEALERARAICEHVHSLPVLSGRGGKITRVTTSQGLASFPRHASDLKTLKERADQALYQAKEEGRDRVVTAG
ncbi:MAG TPA: GGDEF domain-containing protein [Spirochaetia bacterium]|nr:GGDEF domain-containing protein [Spirochaetia bacterium]